MVRNPVLQLNGRATLSLFPLKTEHLVKQEKYVQKWL